MPAEVEGAKVLVTGASGMLGLALCQRLASHFEVARVSKSGRLNTFACDLSDKSQVQSLFASEKPELVIHSAAYSDVDGCEKDPLLAHAANALSTRYLVEACGISGTPLIYVSTDYVFDGRKKELYKETDSTGPGSIYAMTKLTGEYYTKQCASSSVIVRTSWLFGQGNPKTFVNWVIQGMKNEKQVSVLNNQEDSPTFVRDLSEAIENIVIKLLENKDSGKKEHQLFHVCNQGSTTHYGMTLKIKELLGFEKTEVKVIDKSQLPNRVALRPSYSAMSTRFYEQSFGHRMRPWEEALKEYVQSIQ